MHKDAGRWLVRHLYVIRIDIFEFRLFEFRSNSLIPKIKSNFAI